MLIAWEMGLGKTVLGIVLAEERLADDVETVMIICGSSLRYQWTDSLVKFTDMSSVELKVGKQIIRVPSPEYCIIIEGSPAVREKQYQAILDNKPEYVILSYDNLINDWKWVRKIKPDMIIADEITAVKSPRAQRTRKLKNLKVKYRYGLTGTPVENGKPEELFSIMQWVDESIFGRYDLFDKTFIERNDFGWVEGYKNLPLLHKKLSQAMVRRTRQQPEVKKYLPEVEEVTKYTKMDSKTAKLYSAVAKDLLESLKALRSHEGFSLEMHYQGYTDMDSAAGKIMSKCQVLNMLCSHPDLVKLSAERYEKSEGGSQYAYNLVKKGELDSLNTSAKLNNHVSHLREALDFDSKNKVIVFSFYPEMARIIAKEVSEYGHVFFNGDMTAREKAEAKAQFTNDSECRIFFSSDAGGFGVDLFMANYLFNYDLPESAGKSDQRNARHVRASSQFDNVFIINEIVEGSTEERNLIRLDFKRKVASAVIDNKGADESGRIENDVSSLTRWLMERSV